MASPIPNYFRRIKLLRKLCLDTLTPTENLEVDVWFDHVLHKLHETAAICDHYELGLSRNSFHDDAIAFTKSMMRLYKIPIPFTTNASTP